MTHDTLRKGGNTPKEVDHLIDLSRMLIELGDVQLASKNATAALFALCFLTQTSPRDMAENLFTSLPDREEWEEQILPHILDYPDDYERLTDGE